MDEFRHLGSAIIPATHLTARQRRLGTLPYWATQLAVWFALVSGTDLLVLLFQNEPISWFTIVGALSFSIEMTVCTHLGRLIILGMRRRPRNARTLALVAVACVPLCGLLTSGIAFGLGHLVAVPATEATPCAGDQAVFLLYMGCLYGAAWLAAYYSWTFLSAFHSTETARLRADTVAKEAELIALKAQINPHFFFNSLNTLRALIPRDQKLPRHAITMLAELLHAALTVQSSTTVPLRHELETIDAYLALEQLRFEERLRVSRNLAPASLDCPVPPFALQTLVENAVKFGIAHSVEGGEIAITSTCGSDMLHICVSNPGTISGAPPRSTGLGLNNLRGRLHHLFGSSAHLELRQDGANLVVAELRLPLCSA